MDADKKVTLFLAFVVFGLIGAAIVLGLKVNNISASVVDNSNVVGIKNVQKNEKTSGFLGNPGKTLQASGDKVYIEESEVLDGNIHYYNYPSEKSGKTVYFFVVKAGDGTYRAAANACELCFGSKKGFTQIGENIRCENCGTVYTKDQIALQKGGCNPRPINSNVSVVGGRLVLDVSDVEDSAELF